jgi:hypothetical protein
MVTITTKEERHFLPDKIGISVPKIL